MFKKTNAFKTSKSNLLLVLFILPFHINGQELNFKVKQDSLFIDSFVVEHFKNGESSIIFSKNGKLSIPVKIISQSDSLFLSQSFYKEIFDDSKIKDGIYQMNSSIELESITLTNKFTKVYEPKGKLKKIFNSSTQSVSFKSAGLNDRIIKGIELYFPKGKHHKDFGGYGVNNETAKFKLSIGLTNERDTISLRNTTFFYETLEIKKNRWNYYDLRHLHIDISDFKRIFISVRRLDKEIVVGTKKLRRNQISHLGYNYRYDRFALKVEDNEYYVKAVYLDGRERDDRVLAYRLHYYD